MAAQCHLWFPCKFLKCVFYICEIRHCCFNRDCTECISCWGEYAHFDDVHSSNPWAWHMLPFVCVFLNFLLQCCVVSWVQAFTPLVRLIPKSFIFLIAVSNGIFFLISISDISLLVCKNAFDFWILKWAIGLLQQSHFWEYIWRNPKH